MHEISYTNIVLYSHSIPIPGENEPDDAPIYDDSKDACADIDLTDSDDEEIVKAR